MVMSRQRFTQACTYTYVHACTLLDIASVQIPDVVQYGPLSPLGHMQVPSTSQIPPFVQGHFSRQSFQYLPGGHPAVASIEAIYNTAGA